MERNDSLNEQLMYLKNVINTEKRLLEKKNISRRGNCFKKKMISPRNNKGRPENNSRLWPYQERTSPMKSREKVRKNSSYNYEYPPMVFSEDSDDEIIINPEVEADLLIQAIDIKHHEEILKLYFRKWLRKIFERTVASRSRSSNISDNVKDSFVDVVVDVSSDVLFDFT